MLPSQRKYDNSQANRFPASVATNCKRQAHRHITPVRRLPAIPPCPPAKGETGDTGDARDAGDSEVRGPRVPRETPETPGKAETPEMPQRRPLPLGPATCCTLMTRPHPQPPQQSP